MCCYGEDLAEMLLDQGLAALGKTSVDLAVGRKLERWKVVLATWIKEHAGVNNRWFSERLHMGTIYNISKGIHQEIKKGNRRKGDWRKLKRAKSKA